MTLLTILLAISGSSLVSLVIWLIAIGVIVWLLLWLIAYVGIPEPFNKVAKVIIMVVAVILLINVILGLVGEPFIKWN